MSKVHVKTGDTVVLLKGKYEDKFDKNGSRKTGKVLEVSPKEDKVIVEGINIAQRHTKPRRQGEEGGILSKPIPIRACKVMRVCPKCQKPTRLAHKIGADGKKITVCKKCGAEI